jgi:hypothetical protein
LRDNGERLALLLDAYEKMMSSGELKSKGWRLRAL